MTQLVARLPASFIIGATLSDTLQIAGRQVKMIEMSATWTPAVLTFQGSMDAINYYNLYDEEGEEFMVFVESTRRVYLDNTVLDCQKYIKLRSGLFTNTVPQAGGVVYVEVWSI